MRKYIKKPLFITFFTLICLVCKPQDEKFQLYGKINPESNGKVILLIQSETDNREFSIKSSIVQEGCFYFEGIPFTENLSTLALDNYTTLGYEELEMEVVLEVGNIHVFLDEKSECRGTPLNDLLQQLKDQNGSNPTELISFIKTNSANIIGKEAFYSSYSKYTDEQIEEIMAIADASFIHDEKVDICLRSREIIKSINKQEEVRQSIVGSKIPNLELISETGDSIQIHDFLENSRYIIFDFWASWCGPCIKSMPTFKELAENYQSKGVEMVSISLDEEMNDWQRAIHQVDVPWKHVSDLKGYESELIQAFGVSDVPYSVIVNKEGFILHCVRFPDKNLDSILKDLP